MKHLRSILMTSTIVLGVSYALPAAAQEAAATQETETKTRNLDTIIVTATRREETLQQVPVAVNVVTGDDLENNMIGAVDSIVEVSPSLTFTKGSNDLSSSLNIRGMGTSVFSSAVEPSVSVVVDDVVMARSGQAFQDLIDIERVEVLRGPQSTLFGKNASAGVVSVTTKAPSDVFSGDFDALVAEDGQLEARGSLSGPIGDTAGWRLSAYSKQLDGVTENVYNGEKLNGYDVWGARGKLEFNPTDALKVTFIGDHRNSEATPTYTIRGFFSEASGETAANLIAPVVVGPDNDQVNINGGVYSNSEQSGLSAKAVYSFDNDFELTSVTAWRDFTIDSNLDIDQLPFEEPQAMPFFNFNYNNGTTELTQKSQEFRLASPTYEKFDFLVGLFAFQTEIDRTFKRRWEWNLGDSLLNRSGQFNGSAKNTNLSAFASGNWFVTPDWTVFGGVRALREELSWVGYRNPENVLVEGDVALPGDIGTLLDISDSLEDDAVTGNIGVRRLLGDAGSVYASYSRGYKGGGFDLSLGTIQTTQPVDPEISDAFEVGLKLNTFDGKLSTYLAAFHTTYNDFQAQRQDTDDVVFLLDNAGQVITQGIEAEFVYRPTELTRINFGAALIDAKFEEFPGSQCYLGQTEALGCVNGTQDLSGKSVPYSPDTKFTALIRQEIPFETLPFDGFVQVNGTWQSEIFTNLNQDPNAVQDSYGLLNASFGVQSDDGRYTFSIFGQNLTDEVYTPQIFVAPLAGGRYAQQIARNRHRYIGAQLSYSF
ncbi:TonB-dependent receptor [Hirschia baltica]|uniref:TonB-dependent receptor n=1 Tax=Hirschia baltica (strain ATCC 49814 / DSM 5838 / IFAM 1418) TaxID=582402 RepID=C6XPP6_HIRBI|nr:TonB-dependent receptor [Hirschia baltica]ACT60311.1 TonB-dependent receptor [Hirschia baltica ATCC 49814]